ncbi:YCF48-related protein [Nevskia sp.]|uniref:WD40/YVTN/BNR-like repeat-containing protein n=1 Tax=Nevskia sp. TaxID=1929292 RepID=UPI0025D47794|nr:YCF48-related protein [Nevskia sp.]
MTFQIFKLRPALIASAVLAALASPAWLLAQEEEEAEPDTGVDTTLVARPSVLVPRAASGLLLSVTRAGSKFVAVGQRGGILLSDDGVKWKQVPTPADATLTRVRFVDDSHGWAVGYDGTILATEDGGSNWTLAQFDAAWGRAYYDVLFSDAQNGFVLGGNGRLWRTGDGGKNWEPIESPVFEDQPNLYNLVKLGNGMLLLTGERGLIARSSDDGATWAQLKSPYTGSYFGTVAAGEAGAVVFGLRGNAFHAADVASLPVLTEEELAALREAAANPEASSTAGNPVTEVAGWTELKSGDTESLYGASIADNGDVLLFGGNGRVMKADLAGGQLVRQQLPTNINMNAGLATADSLIVVGTSGVQRFAKP